MKLIKYRVTNFRSVEDSGWIDANDVTALIGTNESGKTNLLVPLWKLNPAKDGQINPTADYPRKRYNEIRNLKEKPVFIEAHFQISDDLADHIAKVTGASRSFVKVAYVARDFGGGYRVSFPDAKTVCARIHVKTELLKAFSDASNEIKSFPTKPEEEAVRKLMFAAITDAHKEVDKHVDWHISPTKTEAIRVILSEAIPPNVIEQSPVALRFQQLVKLLSTPPERQIHPHDYSEARSVIRERIPSFVYYSNYGNLDSEIYLPHVIENMKRTNLGSREESKSRTLKVLFEFVRLKPEEILELGRDVPTGQVPNEEQIRVIAQKKKERDILLQSASTELTDKFRNWWKQGHYRFRFQADGDHFRIWVSDDKRTEDIELEGRSTGLQWFLSFYLIFLVESRDAHEDAILLLDEPGMSLHPLAQRDLSLFFQNLAQTNQLLFTTHSPFLVDPDHLDRVRAVYVDDKGLTVVSPNLYAADGKRSEKNSIYPVYAALGLSVSDTLLQGCQVVVVEGPSDQLYLSTIKNYLISKGLIKPSRELLFVPTGGVKGVKSVVSILGAKDDKLPYVVLDSDTAGLTLAKNLEKDLYAEAKDRILIVETFTKLKNSEIEDLWPSDFLANVVNKLVRGQDDEFSDGLDKKQLIVPQIEKFAAANHIPLQVPGWKVDLARQVKARVLKQPDSIDKDSAEVKTWVEVFRKIVS